MRFPLNLEILKIDLSSLTKKNAARITYFSYVNNGKVISLNKKIERGYTLV